MIIPARRVWYWNTWCHQVKKVTMVLLLQWLQWWWWWLQQYSSIITGGSSSSIRGWLIHTKLRCTEAKIFKIHTTQLSPPVTSVLLGGRCQPTQPGVRSPGLEGTRRPMLIINLLVAPSPPLHSRLQPLSLTCTITLPSSSSSSSLQHWTRCLVETQLNTNLWFDPNASWFVLKYLVVLYIFSLIN